ncbi:uncharacterized protein [Ptychodera flava]|uniref:uncharacterized protein n=1 Tax=Ptychodera flava TaxID=63121 RepID=UPI00396A9661
MLSENNGHSPLEDDEDVNANSSENNDVEMESGEPLLQAAFGTGRSSSLRPNRDIGVELSKQYRKNDSLNRRELRRSPRKHSALSFKQSNDDNRLGTSKQKCSKFFANQVELRRSPRKHPGSPSSQDYAYRNDRILSSGQTNQKSNGKEKVNSKHKSRKGVGLLVGSIGSLSTQRFSGTASGYSDESHKHQRHQGPSQPPTKNSTPFSIGQKECFGNYTISPYKPLLLFIVFLELFAFKKHLKIH